MRTNGRVNGVSAQFIGAQLMGAVNMTVIIYPVSRNLFFHPLQRVFLSPENFLMLLLCKKSSNEPLGRCLAGGRRKLLRSSGCGRCSPFAERSVQREAWASASAEAEGFCKRTSDQPRLSRHNLDPWELDDTSGKS